jgi:hypothetical protein
MMTMKKIFLLLTLVVFVAACNEDFLDTDNLTKKSSANFPGTPEEAQQALTGIYSIQNTVGTGWANIFLYSEYMSDDRFGGGGMHDPNPQAANYFLVANSNIHAPLWAGYYQGIYRCNTLLGSLQNVKGLAGADRKKIVGEASFLRGLYYFDLARMFSTPEVIDGHQGTVPLVLNTVPADLPRATEEELYGQIALDLKVAIDSLPADPITPAWNTNNLGRTSKWAAEGMMARVFLFYTGYYKKSELPLAGGGSITKAQVIEWVDDLIANSGRTLVPDFRNQWPYTIDQNSYKYAKDNNLHWVGEANNPENIYQIVFTGFSSNVWGEKSNYVNGFFNTGQRDPTARLVIGHGWGFGPVNPRLYAEWPSDDLRKQGSIYYVDDATEGLDYVKAADNQWNETYYMDKKYSPVNIKNSKGEIVNWSHTLYEGIDNNIQLESVQNMVLLRLADVYLMGAELGSARAQEYFDKVRGRGVPSYVAGSLAPTLDNIKKERRYELAFEGVRYWDLLRWYGVDAGDVIHQNESGAKIYNIGVETTINQDRSPALFSNVPTRVRNTGGFNMIPQDQIDLSNALVQNPGWLNPGEYMFQF